MKDSELRDLLRRAGAELPEPDVAESTWSRGRVSRRRRWTLQVVGGLAAVAVVGGLGGQVAGWPDSGLRSTADVAGGSEISERFEPPPVMLAGPPPSSEITALEEARARADEAPRVRSSAEDGAQLETVDVLPSVPSSLVIQTQQVWADVYTGCLESRGYVVARDGAALSVTFPDGRQDGDYRRDTAACRAELVTDAPTSQSPTGGPRSGLDGTDRAALMEHYFDYYWVQSCLVDAGLPTAPPMLAEEFISGLAWAQLPPWHPYQEAAREGRYAEAREACPIQAQP